MMKYFLFDIYHINIGFLIQIRGGELELGEEEQEVTGRSANLNLYSEVKPITRQELESKISN